MGDRRWEMGVSVTVFSFQSEVGRKMEDLKFRRYKLEFRINGSWEMGV